MDISILLETVVCPAADPRCLKKAQAALEAGQVVAIPTDTVYGLAADAANDLAVHRLLRVKQRPPDRPLPIFVPSVERVPDIAQLGETGERLAQLFWPGPLTIVAPRAPGFRSMALLGGRTVGVRIPNCPPVLELLRRLGRPLAVTSANRSGERSASTAEEVVAALGGLIPVILDGGKAGGIESTVVDITGTRPRVLREGALTERRVLQALGIGGGRL